MKFGFCMTVLFLLGLVSTARADGAISKAYSVVDYNWCNGPYSGKDGAGCPAPLAFWERVDLKRLTQVSISSAADVSSVEIADSNGMTWKTTSSECNSKPSDAQGCMMWADFKDPNKISVHLSMWSLNQRSQRLSFEIKDDAELSVFSPDNSYLVLDVKPIK